MNCKYLIVPIILVVVGCHHPVTTRAVPPPATEDGVQAITPTRAKRRVIDVPLWTQTIAVLDPHVQVLAPKGSPIEITEPITEKIETAFLSTGRFELVERARLDSAKTELTTTTDPLFWDQSSVAKMGQFLGAKLIILPTARLEVGVLSTRLDLDIKVEDVATGSIVQTFEVRTSSTSLSTNSSITACLNRIRIDVADAIAATYPAQAMIVHSPKPGIFWAEAKHMTSFYPGEKVRVLESQDVFNPVKGTSASFTVEAGRGRIQSVEAYGLVIKAPGVTADPGWLIEVIP